jgi:HNH endonuclease
LRIALRKSGGRGEYELAGSQGRIKVTDLLNHALLFELTPELRIAGHSEVRLAQGKPRIRLDDPQEFRHAYRILAGVLLLPQPKRALRDTVASWDFLYDGKYAVTDIDVDIAELDKSRVVLRPTKLCLGNVQGFSRSVDFSLRMSQIQSLWDAAQAQEGSLAALVREHEQAVLAGDQRGIIDAAAVIRRELGNAGDSLNELVAHLGTVLQDAAISPSSERASSDGVDDEVEPEDAARRAIAKWRRSVVRSAQGRAFSQRVRAEYQDRCALSGDVLPKLPSTVSAGVDGAHILPWARYELNTISNGICLNKLCHWAFDAGVIRIDFDPSLSEYLVSIPDRVHDEGLPLGMSLDYFASLEGPIPASRLPQDVAKRPSPKYLERLNAEVFG